MNQKTLLFTIFMIATLILSACAPVAAPTQPAPAETQAVEQPTSPPAAVTQAPEPTTAPEPTKPPEPTQPPAPVVLKIANTANITTWDPVKSFSIEAAYMGNLYEQLLRINPPGSADRYTPLLATSWESSADGMTWTFHLREGVKFHDGEPLTAEAVKQSIEAAKDHGGASFIWAPVDTIEAVDDLTVKFNLKYAAPVDLIASSLYGSWIVSPKALDAFAADDKYWEKGVEAGTGPYMLESYTPDEEIVFTRFTDYWGGWQPGQYDKVVVSIVPEATTQQQMLEGGQVDLVRHAPIGNQASFKDNPNYTYYEEQSFFNYVGFFNTLRPPLDNVKVRQALSYAIPYQDIITIAVTGLARKAAVPCPPVFSRGRADVNQYTYDLEKAKTLLEEAGHQGGGFKLKLTYTSENDAEAAFAPLIKDFFAQIGVDVTIEAIAFNEQWDAAIRAQGRRGYVPAAVLAHLCGCRRG